MDKKHILIVDDTPANLQLLGNILNDSYALSFATGGLEALEILKKTSPDLVLLDIMMPRIDGFEVCRRIKKDPEKERTPIIFLTAKTDRESVLTGMALGAQDYIIKPFSSEDVTERINNQLKKGDICQLDSSQRSEEETEAVFLQNRGDNILTFLSEVRRTVGEECTVIEQHLAPVVNTVSQVLTYIRELEGVLCSESALKNKQLQSDFIEIQSKRMEPELNASMLTMSETLYDMQFSLFDMISNYTESGSDSIKKNRFTLRRFLTDLKQLIPRDVDYFWELNEDREVKGEEESLLQVLIALIDNALDLQDSSAKSSCSVHISESGRGVRISVLDTGPGMTLSQLEKACQAGTSSKSSRKGYGLTAASLLLKKNFNAALLPHETHKGIMINL